MTTNDTIEALEAQNEMLRATISEVYSWLGDVECLYEHELDQHGAHEQDGCLLCDLRYQRDNAQKALQSPRHDLSKIKAVLRRSVNFWRVLPKKDVDLPVPKALIPTIVALDPIVKAVKALSPEQRESILKGGE